jgi:Protein of unknown function (DUF3592)
MALNRDNARWYAILLLSISLLMLFLAGYFSSLAWERFDSRSWPRVPGSVVRNYSTLTCGSSRAFKSWEARIVYRYVVDGLAHEASRVAGSSILCDASRNEVNGWLNSHYPVGKRVDVFYNPSDHDAAFLEAGQVGAFDIGMILAALMMSGLMAIGVWASLRVRAAKSPFPSWPGATRGRR